MLLQPLRRIPQGSSRITRNGANHSGRQTQSALKGNDQDPREMGVAASFDLHRDLLDFAGEVVIPLGIILGYRRAFVHAHIGRVVG